MHCRAVWAVGAGPSVLCPRCGGRLSAPTIASVPLVIPPPGQVRWVAMPPPDALPRPAAPTRAVRVPDADSATPTPSYPDTPTWGLWETGEWYANRESGQPPESAIERWARRAPGLLLVTAALYAAAASAELVRYLVLVYNRTHLIPLWMGAVSDTLVWLASPAAIVLALIAAPAATCRLTTERAAVYDAVDLRDPRSIRSLALGCLVPVVNWICPGIFLTEIDRSGAIPRAHGFTAAVRWWWGLWILGWAMLIGQLLLRRRDGLQAAADGVLFSAVTDLVAAAVAVATLVVFRRLRDEAIAGGPRRPRRWVISVEGDAMVDKAIPGAIAPIRAIASSAPRTSETEVSGTNISGTDASPSAAPTPQPTSAGTERP